MYTWILTLMLALQPAAPWLDSYEATARAIDVEAHAAPLYSGDDGPERTAADLVALFWFESRFDPKAVGDHGRSVCAGQIDESNLRRLGTTRAELLSDVGACTRATLRMIRESHRVCAVQPKEERLGWYAAGGGDCSRGLPESRHRTRLAAYLLRAHRVRWVERS